MKYRLILSLICLALSASSFAQLTAVKDPKKDLWGYQQPDGKWKHKPKYVSVTPFDKYGYSLATEKDGDRYLIHIDGKKYTYVGNYYANDKGELIYIRQFSGSPDIDNFPWQQGTKVSRLVKNQLSPDRELLSFTIEPLYENNLREYFPACRFPLNISFIVNDSTSTIIDGPLVDVKFLDNGLLYSNAAEEIILSDGRKIKASRKRLDKMAIDTEGNPWFYLNYLNDTSGKQYAQVYESPGQGVAFIYDTQRRDVINLEKDAVIGTKYRQDPPSVYKDGKWYIVFPREFGDNGLVTAPVEYSNGSGFPFVLDMGMTADYYFFTQGDLDHGTGRFGMADAKTGATLVPCDYGIYYIRGGKSANPQIFFLKKEGKVTKKFRYDLKQHKLIPMGTTKETVDDYLYMRRSSYTD